MNADELIKIVQNCTDATRITIKYSFNDSVIFDKPALTNMYKQSNNTVVLEFNEGKIKETVNTSNIRHIRCNDYAFQQAEAGVE